MARKSISRATQRKTTRAQTRAQAAIARTGFQVIESDQPPPDGLGLNWAAHDALLELMRKNGYDTSKYERPPARPSWLRLVVDNTHATESRP